MRIFDKDRQKGLDLVAINWNNAALFTHTYTQTCIVMRCTWAETFPRSENAFPRAIAEQRFACSSKFAIIFLAFDTINPPLAIKAAGLTIPSTREVAQSVRGKEVEGTSQQCELIKRGRGQRGKTPTQECANKCEKCECRASKTRPDLVMMNEKIPCK